MDYQDIHPGIFLERPNRFIALCKVEGKIQRVHVKNTGRCKELLIPGTIVYLEKSQVETRKTLYDLVSIMKNNHFINIDSQAPNKVVEEMLVAKKINFAEINDLNYKVKREYTWRQSRFDFLIEGFKERVFIEVKGVTLEEEGVALFPDAPTERGVRHIRHLSDSLEEGYKAILLFIIQMNYTQKFMPNLKTHIEFAYAMKEAAQKGVGIYTVKCDVSQNSLNILPETLERFKADKIIFE